MKSIEIQSRDHCYRVLIAGNLLEQTGPLIRSICTNARCAVITDNTVASLFAEKTLASLRAAGFAPVLIPIAAGESAKSMAQAEAVCEAMSAAGLDRTSFLVALGGGVVSDLAGFVAAIYLRGIPFVSIPTTLLAQVDSCIGGKTGVNSAAGKNSIGRFHPPALVIADTDTLRTLPRKIWNEGFAEIIKHGIIRDPDLFARVENGARFRLADDANWSRDLAWLIERNLTIKAEIVSKDEREKTGTRSLLNFGHTVGHAIEFAANYRNILHGEAISLGIVAAAEVSVQRAGLSLGEAERIKAALHARGLPIALPVDFPRGKILEALPRDKKFEDGQVRFVVAHAIGRASIATDVTMEDLRLAVETL